MTIITYRVVEHEGGWAYRLGDVFSEPYATSDQARLAAHLAAERQRSAGTSGDVEYEDAGNQWHREIADGKDRPETIVEDD